MRRTVSAVAVAALLSLGLSACGSGGSGGDSGGDDTTDASASSTSSTSGEEESKKPVTTTTTTTTTTAPRSSSTSSSSSESKSESDEAPDSGEGGATSIQNVWVDDSWSVEEVSEDVCAPGGLSHSYYTQQGNDVFTCGPTAASALACTAEFKETTCITNALARKAIRFDSDVVEDPGEILSRESDPIPLYVELQGGVKCATISHDHDQHWGGKYSWYRCSDQSELLTDEDIGDTFDTSDDAWTVQRSSGKAAPVETSVKTAVYAGE